MHSRPGPRTPFRGPQPPAEESDEGDRVVVTGSFIQGTPEDAALPVEVFSQEELEEQGAPTALEFAKSLTIAGPTTGEAYYFSGAALTGSVNYNLRGLGADKTLILLNGRRMSQNTSNIPSAALARTEDPERRRGGDLRRRRHRRRRQLHHARRLRRPRSQRPVQVHRRLGWRLRPQHSRRHRRRRRQLPVVGGMGAPLAPGDPRNATARCRRIRREPGAVVDADQRRGWLPRGALPASIRRTTRCCTGSRVRRAPSAGFSATSRQAICEAVGGVYNPNGVATGIPTCAYNYISYYNLVEENDIYRAFAQLNASVNDNMDFHFDALLRPGEVAAGVRFAGSAGHPWTGAWRRARRTSSTRPSTNPYVQAVPQPAGRCWRHVGWRSALLRRAFTPLTYRAFAHGGNPFLRRGQRLRRALQDRQPDLARHRPASTAISATGPASAKDVGYDFAVTYNQSIATPTRPTSSVTACRTPSPASAARTARVGRPQPEPVRHPELAVGPLPHARRSAATTGTRSLRRFANQPELGLANPRYLAGSENRDDVARWLFDDRATETINSSLTADLVFNGMSGIQLARRRDRLGARRTDAVSSSSARS